jgi:hypothetical protein
MHGHGRDRAAPGADPTLGWCDSQTEFEFTLDLLLDGLERERVSSRRVSGHGEETAPHP